MYCYVVKWPVFSLQRGSAKWPIAPSNFSSLWLISCSESGPNLCKTCKKHDFIAIVWRFSSPRGKNRCEKGLICYFDNLIKFWPLLHKKQLSSVGRALCQAIILFLPSSFGASSNHITSNITEIEFQISVTYWINLEVLPHDFCKLPPPKLYKKVPELFSQAENLFSAEIWKMRECLFWVDVMLRQPRVWASRASPAQK